MEQIPYPPNLTSIAIYFVDYIERDAKNISIGYKDFGMKLNFQKTSNFRNLILSIVPNLKHLKIEDSNLRLPFTEIVQFIPTELDTLDIDGPTPAGKRIITLSLSILSLFFFSDFVYRKY